MARWRRHSRPPDVIASLKAQEMDAEPSTPEALRARIAAEIDKWRKLATTAGIKAEP